MGAREAEGVNGRAFPHTESGVVSTHCLLRCIHHGLLDLSVHPSKGIEPSGHALGGGEGGGDGKGEVRRWGRGRDHHLVSTSAGACFGIVHTPRRPVPSTQTALVCGLTTGCAASAAHLNVAELPVV